MDWMRWLLRAGVVVLVVAPTARGSGAGDDRAALLRMHGEFVDAFVDGQGFGKRRVTPMMAKMRHYQFEGVDEAGRCVLDVELVGVARHAPPVVHGATFTGFQHSDEDDAVPMPPMTTRHLQAWERDALAALVAGGDVVVNDGPGGERAMGPIRARPACLGCHRGHREGDVLGALSYGLGRIAVPADAPDRRFCQRTGLNAASVRPLY
jgi:hypothetical protein